LRPFHRRHLWCFAGLWKLPHLGTIQTRHFIVRNPPVGIRRTVFVRHLSRSHYLNRKRQHHHQDVSKGNEPLPVHFADLRPPSGQDEGRHILPHAQLLPLKLEGERLYGHGRQALRASRHSRLEPRRDERIHRLCRRQATHAAPYRRCP
ncbi:hypothetical protein ACHAWF_000091, partial [Thalassiosira exigua]